MKANNLSHDGVNKMRIAEEYLRVIDSRFKALKVQGDRSFHQLSDEKIHWRLNETSNSIAVIAKHLSGNMISRWTDFLTTDGEKSTRKRDDEFIDDIASLDALITIWDAGWEVLFQSIQSLTPDDLLKQVKIRGEEQSVIDAIERQIAHYASHIGQIIYIAKQINDKDWKTLSIPKGQSEAYRHEMLKKNKKK